MLSRWCRASWYAIVHSSGGMRAFTLGTSPFVHGKWWTGRNPPPSLGWGKCLLIAVFGAKRLPWSRDKAVRHVVVDNGLNGVDALAAVRV